MPCSVRVKLIFSYPDPVLAKKLLDSIAPDNGDYIDSRVEGNTIISEARGESILRIRSTLDDLLACLATSERVIMEKENWGGRSDGEEESRKMIDGNYIVTDEIEEGYAWVFEDDSVMAIEKLDGTNVSIVIEEGTVTQVYNRTERIPFINKGKK